MEKLRFCKIHNPAKYIAADCHGIIPKIGNVVWERRITFCWRRHWLLSVSLDCKTIRNFGPSYNQCILVELEDAIVNAFPLEPSIRVPGVPLYLSDDVAMDKRR